MALKKVHGVGGGAEGRMTPRCPFLKALGGPTASHFSSESKSLRGHCCLLCLGWDFRLGWGRGQALLVSSLLIAAWQLPACSVSAALSVWGCRNEGAGWGACVQGRGRWGSVASREGKGDPAGRGLDPSALSCRCLRHISTSGVWAGGDLWVRCLPR